MISTGKFMWLVVFALLCAAVSVYYYFRVIQAMYFKDGEGTTEAEPSSGFKGLLVVLAVAVIVLGVFPQTLLDQLSRFIYTW